MSRLTEYKQGKNSNFPYKLKDEGVNTELDCIHKLGRIEDLFEKYNVENIEELEKILKIFFMKGESE